MVIDASAEHVTAATDSPEWPTFVPVVTSAAMVVSDDGAESGELS